MRGRLLALVATSALTSGAIAAEKPVIGPAPSWVKPVGLPASSKDDSAPVRILLSDQQIAFEPGRQTVYSEIALKIQAPQGLAAGNLSVPWRPDTDVLTVHKLLIHRGNQTIDVLASGQTFTVLRREQNLESATLDGVLTANIQPEGLQVGDVLDYAFSLTSSDPTLKGHVEQIAGTWNGASIGRAHMHMQWPSTVPMRFRETTSLPALRPVKTGGITSIDLSADDLQPTVPPKGAPPRYILTRMVEATDYASWADLGALMAPLYDKASVLPAQGPLRMEVERIRAASAGPKSRAEAALALVQDRTRYVALAMGSGGYVPADAELTWSRRYGDCKAKTALLLGLLHSLAIQAEPVAVSTIMGNGLDERLPMVTLFNHVLVRATIAGRVYWLDGTRQGDTSLDRLTVPYFGWGLPLVAKGAALVPMVPSPLATPQTDTSIRIDAHAGITAPAPVEVETILRGDEAIGTNAALATVVGDARDRALRDYWKGQYDFIDVKTATTRFDPQTGEMHLAMTGMARMDWSSGWYETDGTGVGYKADFTRDPGSTKDAPYAVDYPTFTRTTETIVLPPHVTDGSTGENAEVNQTVAGIEYHRHASVTGDTFRIERSERSIEPEFAASEAPAAQAALRSLAEKTVYLRRPSSYLTTDADLAAALQTTPSTADGFVDRGNALLDHQRYAEAIKDFDQALTLDPRNANALADRALAEIRTHEFKDAVKSLDAAQAIDPRNAVVFRGRGLLAHLQANPKAAIEAFTTALGIEPNNSFALLYRALANQVLDNEEAALADADAATKLFPTWADPYAVRASIYLGRHQRDRAIAEMKAVIALDPKQAEAHAAAARIYQNADQPDDALKEYTAAIEIKPTAALYAARSTARRPGDQAARDADIDAALKLDPSSKEALVARAGFQQDAGNIRAAIATWTKLVELSPGDAGPLAARARAYKLAGDVEQALADSGSALKLQPRAIDLYLLRANLFRSVGDHEDALGEAAAAEAAAPELAYTHVVAANIYIAFGENAKAISAYDRALAIKPEAYIFLNRGMRRPKSDAAARMADIDAAIAIDPGLPEAWAEKAKLQMDQHDFTSAVATLSVALGKSPDDADLRADRGIAYARAGDAANSQKDFAAARAMVSRPYELNSLCWRKATVGVALETALAECNAALAQVPDAPDILDSRGLVLLRLGRIDEAIADYDRALGKNPRAASSLFGRSIAWARKGDKSKAAADAAAALKSDPNIATEYEDYGVKS